MSEQCLEKHYRNPLEKERRRHRTNRRRTRKFGALEERKESEVANKAKHGVWMNKSRDKTSEARPTSTNERKEKLEYRKARQKQPNAKCTHEQANNMSVRGEKNRRRKSFKREKTNEKNLTPANKQQGRQSKHQAIANEPKEEKKKESRM